MDPRVRSRSRAALLLAGALLLASPLAAQMPGYRNHAGLTAALDSVRRAHPRLVELSVVATSPGGRAVQAVRLGAGQGIDTRPALLVLANAHGPHLIGSEIALGTVRRLAAAYGRDTAVTALLDRVTLYVVPRLNPDAAEAAFRSPRHERTFNESADDADHDGNQDEDGPDDLDGNGLITRMRVMDPAGEWMPDPRDPWLMRRADAAKGEQGGWLVRGEGRDTDGDGAFDEDPPGGTDINRNFAHDYPYFGEGAGLHPFSAPETRGLAEFVVARGNIAAAYVLGPQDNLMEPWKHRPRTGDGAPEGTSQGGPFTSILRGDEGWFAEVSGRFRKTTGLTKTPPSAPLGGDAATWLYYHMGRLAFASRGWWVPDAPADTTADGRKAPAATGSDPLADERNAMKWFRTQDSTALLPWTRVTHPDYPGRTVEVGGFRPFALLNPPASLVDTVVATHAGFVQELAGMLPAVALREVRAEPLGGGAWRITAQVANTGYLPTLSAIGARARWARQVKVTLSGTGLEVAGGRAVQQLAPIAGSGRSTELSWVVTGARGTTVTLRAESPAAGSDSTTVTLR